MLDLLPAGLTEGAWLVALDLVTIAMALLWGRGTPRLDVHVRRLRRPRVGALVGALCLVAAAVLAATALVLGLNGAQAQERRQPFVDVWLVPQQGGKVEVGVRSGRSDRTAYRIVLRAENRVLRAWPSIQLGFGQQWQDIVTLPRSVRAGRLLRVQVFAGRNAPALETIRVRSTG